MVTIDIRGWANSSFQRYPSTPAATECPWGAICSTIAVAAWQECVEISLWYSHCSNPSNLPWIKSPGGDDPIIPSTWSARIIPIGTLSAGAANLLLSKRGMSCGSLFFSSRIAGSWALSDVQLLVAHKRLISHSWLGGYLWGAELNPHDSPTAECFGVFSHSKGFGADRSSSETHSPKVPRFQVKVPK